jgi:hypothetical protein
MFLCGSTAAGLHRRTRHRTVRAEHAAIAFQWLEAFAAGLAVIEELAGIGGHCLGSLMATLRAGDRSVHNHAPYDTIGRPDNPGKIQTETLPEFAPIARPSGDRDIMHHDSAGADT